MRKFLLWTGELGGLGFLVFLVFLNEIVVWPNRLDFLNRLVPSLMVLSALFFAFRFPRLGGFIFFGLAWVSYSFLKHYAILDYTLVWPLAALGVVFLLGGFFKKEEVESEQY